MAKYPEMQAKLRKEVEDEIGDRLAIQEDKSNCHYVNAFMSEVLRLRPVVPMSLPHKAMVDTQISKILLLGYQYSHMNILIPFQRVIRSRRTRWWFSIHTAL
jgi:hypothetical protein